MIVRAGKVSNSESDIEVSKRTLVQFWSRILKRVTSWRSNGPSPKFDPYFMSEISKTSRVYKLLILIWPNGENGESIDLKTRLIVQFHFRIWLWRDFLKSSPDRVVGWSHLMKKFWESFPRFLSVPPVKNKNHDFGQKMRIFSSVQYLVCWLFHAFRRF